MLRGHTNTGQRILLLRLPPLKYRLESTVCLLKNDSITVHNDYDGGSYHDYSTDYGVYSADHSCLLAALCRQYYCKLRISIVLRVMSSSRRLLPQRLLRQRPPRMYVELSLSEINDLSILREPTSTGEHTLPLPLLRLPPLWSDYRSTLLSIN